MKDGALYSDNEKVGKHKNSVIYVVAGGSDTAWTATSDEINEYFDGLTIACRTTVGGGYPNTTLDINGLGGKQIRRAANASVTYDY
jgi:hypothetical protein